MTGGVVVGFIALMFLLYIIAAMLTLGAVITLRWVAQLALRGQRPPRRTPAARHMHSR